MPLCLVAELYTQPSCTSFLIAHCSNREFTSRVGAAEGAEVGLVGPEEGAAVGNDVGRAVGADVSTVGFAVG